MTNGGITTERALAVCVTAKHSMFASLTSTRYTGPLQLDGDSGALLYTQHREGGKRLTEARKQQQKTFHIVRGLTPGRMMVCASSSSTSIPIKNTRVENPSKSWPKSGLHKI
jgi:hypothetical protein